MTAALRSDLSGDGYIQVNGIDRLKIGADGAITILGAGSKITGLGAAETGDFVAKQRKTTPAGWIPAIGGTIGAPASGATRANLDTLDLFTLWWAEYTDGELPILTSTGTASTRGVSAAADWAANKRLSVFDVRDRVIRAPGTVQGNGTKLEATVVFDNGGTLSPVGQQSIAVLPGTSQATRNGDGADNLNSSPWMSVATATNAALALTGQKVRVASHGIPGFYKL